MFLAAKAADRIIKNEKDSVNFMQRGTKVCVMAALSAVLLLTACTGVEMGTLESAGSRADQTENVDLTVMIDETTVLYYRDMVEELRQEFSEYGIHSIEWSLPEVEKTVKTAMARKESIEVVKWFPNQTFRNMRRKTDTV